MKVKIFILELLIFYLLNSNFACAEHWAYIGTSNGKPGLFLNSKKVLWNLNWY